MLRLAPAAIELMPLITPHYIFIIDIIISPLLPLVFDMLIAIFISFAFDIISPLPRYFSPLLMLLLAIDAAMPLFRFRRH
jgi:hypothetical protein